MSRSALLIGILLLFLTEILRVYFIMPFPGSQHTHSIDFAYFIGRNKWLLRLIGLLLISYPVYRVFTTGKNWKKILLASILVFWGVVFYLFNFRFEADSMFYQPAHKNFSSARGGGQDGNQLVIGVEINGEAKAFPIQIIGYHHQVRDTIGHEPVMITYCTVCRTGRVYSLLVNNHPEIFRLVGMDHFNAMFEDLTTKSWWQQATGVAIAGPLKGSALKEIPSHQSSLSAWLREFPDSKILQPDTLYRKNYADLAGYDNGTIHGGLEKRDSASWKNKSWVIGVKTAQAEKAYDWNEVIKHPLIQDSLNHDPIMLLLEDDSISFHVYSSQAGGQTLSFVKEPLSGILSDTQTHSRWNMEGYCLSGPLKETQLQAIPAYQEFWHSWKQFHPNTTQYK